jgi:hypothetical protein
MDNNEGMQRMIKVHMSIVISHVSTSTCNALSMILNVTMYDVVLFSKTGTSLQELIHDR